MTLPALHQLITQGDLAGFTQALQDGADPNQLDPTMGNAPLHIAAQRSDIAFVQALLEHGAFINQQVPKHGVTPLMVAVWHRKPALVACLLADKYINVEISSHFGLKAQQLIDLGAADDDQFGQQQAEQIRALFEQHHKRQLKQQAAMEAFNIVTAPSSSDQEKASRMRALSQLQTLNATSAITSSGNDEHTAVMVAARDGLVASLRQLMELGGDQQIPDHYMQAIPLYKAAYNGHAAVIELLAGYPGFQEALNAQGPNNGYTPRHDAVWHGHLKAAQALIDAGADTKLRAYDGTTPLELAEEYQYQELVELLGAEK
ncbi:ankyrin repeat domain-containing protein [Aliagarivorans taiwanensis]|uniref:ankyrin repeat domain-containing protein n=1 Tax=Aliagarivorans taiwanensis TaxID=561966 RepID=UPI000424D768|nr:ankyrin repeat domain-containing protein [Aliagarivorans taiwanensis]